MGGGSQPGGEDIRVDSLRVLAVQEISFVESSNLRVSTVDQE